MLKKLEVDHFTVFPHATLNFASGLNVIIGENGLGKTHILKLAYSLLAVSAEGGRKYKSEFPTKNQLQGRIAEKLIGVFRPESLGRLAQRKQGRERCAVAAKFKDTGLNTTLSFATQSKSEVKIDKLPQKWLSKAPVFLPTRELLSLYPNFVSVYDNHYLEIEETYRDTCILLGSPPIKGPREKRVSKLVAPIEKIMGGKMYLDKNGRFYLSVPQKGNMEIPLVAEGWRKLGMVASLIATGSLLDKGYLFWDEPETNLNPKLIKLVAEVILHLCNNGIQVFIATHSLFLLRELELLGNRKEFKEVKNKFFALSKEEEGVAVSQGRNIDDVDPIAALDESLLQSDRYMDEV